MELIDLDLMNVELGKWPLLVVVGTPVTLEQAMEIIIRTDELYLSSNDAEFSIECANYLYDLPSEDATPIWGYWHPEYAKAFKVAGTAKTDYKEYQAVTDRAREEVHTIGLRFLHNSRIVSTWIGGAHGWCNWDGTINCGNYNIGSWPTVGDVYEDWKTIANAFPYLDLKCQLVVDCVHDSARHGACRVGGSLITEKGEGVIAVEFTVKDGVVTISSPGPALCPVIEPDTDTERGCTIEQFKAAVDYTRTLHNT